MILVDLYFYRKILVAPVNIILYNVFSTHGPNLYGTAPWHYYIINLFLNFNVALILACIGSISVYIRFFISQPTFSSFINTKSLWLITALLLWMTLMLKMEHKEERFLFVVYHLVCFAAAFGLCTIDFILERLGAWLLRSNILKVFPLLFFIED